MKRLLLTTCATVLAAARLVAADAEADFTPLFDGKSFTGWKMAAENPQTWKIEDGALVAHGERCHLFYVGDEKPFQNFELKVDVMTEPGSNGGIYFHTKYQETGWPKYGFESQVNNTHGDPKKTGGLYGVDDVKESAAQDDKWWVQHIIVKGKKITVKIDGKTVVDYTEPDGKEAGKDFTRVVDQGTFALQGHDPKSVVWFKNIRVKRLD